MTKRAGTDVAVTYIDGSVAVDVGAGKRLADPRIPHAVEDHEAVGREIFTRGTGGLRGLTCPSRLRTHDGLLRRSLGPHKKREHRGRGESEARCDRGRVPARSSANADVTPNFGLAVATRRNALVAVAAAGR